MAKSPNKFIQAPNGVVYQQTESGVRQALCYTAEPKPRIINMPSGVTVVQKDGFALASMEQVKAVLEASAEEGRPAAVFLVEDAAGNLSPYAFPEPAPAPAPAPQA